MDDSPTLASLRPVEARRVRVVDRRATPGARSAAPESRRDLRIDFLRGVAMFAVLVNHLYLPSAYRLVTADRIGVVSGAEAFVLLSGIVLGIVNRQRLMRSGFAACARRMWRRAATLYAVSLGVNVSVMLLGALALAELAPLFYEAPRAPFALPGPSARVDWPEFLLALVTLNPGVAPVDVLGLYVGLLVLAPLVVALLRRGHVLPLLGASWGMWLYYALQPVAVLPFQSEVRFPVLAWQLLFVHGFAAGFHRDALWGYLRGPRGRWVLPVAGVVAAAGFLYANVDNAAAFVGLGWPSTPDYDAVYYALFEGPPLDLGRVLNVVAVVVVLYAVLDRFWPVLSRAAGWWFVPIGQASLYVFAIHVFLLLGVAQLLTPGQESSRVLSTAAATFVLMTTWLMVRHKVLFRLIPR